MSVITNIDMDARTRLCLRLLKVLLELHAAAHAPPSRRGGLGPWALKRVQRFIEASLARPVQVAELAEHVGLSAYHFARAFKASTGSTPRAFREARRIERAQKLLRESELPLAQIAVETGFGTHSHFTTTFRRATGFTPATYRRTRRAVRP